jgi:hypothetical protein
MVSIRKGEMTSMEAKGNRWGVSFGPVFLQGIMTQE